MKKCLLILHLQLFIGGHTVAAGEISPEKERVIYAMSIVFAETPFSDIRPAEIINMSEVGGKKHFEFHYDSLGRLVELSYKQRSKLIAFSDRFVRAPLTRFTYTDST